LIPGGYYIVARKRPEIQGAPPIAREVYNYLNAQANYENRESSGRVISRGQCVRTYEDIQEGLAWYVGFRKMKYSKDQIEGALKWLVKHELITKVKTTRGLIITIENYDFYQTPGNYEYRNEDHKKTTADPQPADAINNELEEDKKTTLLGLATKLPDFFYKDVSSLDSQEKAYTMRYLRAEFKRCCRKIGKSPQYFRKLYAQTMRDIFARYNMNFAHIINFLYYYFDVTVFSKDYVDFFDWLKLHNIEDYKKDWLEVKAIYGNSEMPVTDTPWWRDLYEAD